MATYDLLMLAVLGTLTLYGYFKGMAWQIAYIASFVGSYFMAIRFADRVAPNITFVNPPVNKFVAMLLIYAVASFVVWTVFRVIRRGIDRVKMDGFDHQMGAIIGFLRGVLWCVGVTFFAMTLLPATQKQHIIASRSGHYIARLVNETESLFPPEVHQVIGPYLNRLGNELNQPGQAPRQPTGWPQQQQRAPTQNWPQNGSSQPAPGWGQQSTGWPPAASQAGPAPVDPGGLGWPQPANDNRSPSTPAQPVNWGDWPSGR